MDKKSIFKRGRIRMLATNSPKSPEGCGVENLGPCGFNFAYGTYAGVGSDSFPFKGPVSLKELKENEEINLELMEKVKAAKVKFIAYTNFANFREGAFSKKEVEAMAAEHLKFRWTFDMPGRRYACFNKPAFRKFLFDKCVYMIKDLGATGIGWDNVGMQVGAKMNCVCKYCREKYSQEVGENLDEIGTREAILEDAEVHQKNKTFKEEKKEWENTKYRRYLEWRERDQAEFFKKLREDVEKAVGRKVIWLANGHLIGAYYVKRAIKYHQFDGNGNEAGYTYPPNLNVYGYKMGTAIGQNKDITYTWSRVRESVPTSSMVKIMSAEAVAFGGTFIPWNIYFACEPNLVNAQRKVTQFLARWEELYASEEDIADITILYSYNSEEYASQSAEPKGISELLTDMCIPFEIAILERDLTLSWCKNKKVLILPNIEMLSKNDFNILKQFADKGGRLIITGNTGYFDEDYKVRKEKLKGKNVRWRENCVGTEHSTNRLYGPDMAQMLKPPDEKFKKAVAELLLEKSVETNLQQTTGMNLTKNKENINVHLVNYDLNRYGHRKLGSAKNVRVAVKHQGRLSNAWYISFDIPGDIMRLKTKKKGKWIEALVPELIHYGIVQFRQ